MSQVNKDRIETVKEKATTWTQNGIIAVVLFVLMQFALVGPAAEKKATELEGRITRVETRMEAMDSAAVIAANDTRRQLDAQEKFLNERFRSIDSQLSDIKGQLRANRWEPNP